MNADVYLGKARQCLAGAELALAHGQYNNAVNRAYYAAFQAAIARLTAAEVRPPTPRYWGHDFVLREFCRLQPPRPAEPLDACGPVALKALQDARLKADYDVEMIGEVTARRAVALARAFVGAAEQWLAREVVCPTAPSSPPHGARSSH
ncbi:MAG: HEPN domain-containing protein [Chloroflexi bacterium]|nr:HEPN domain-containing protein [Chloroflexota bacterium]